jgi:serine/threonine protein kinase
MAERQILELIESPFIVKLHYAFQSYCKLYLIVDFMIGGELYNHIMRSGRFSLETSKFYAA